MTARTDQAAQLLRDELHERTLYTDPEQAYATAGELGDILGRVRQLLGHLQHASTLALGADDPGEAAPGTTAGRPARIDAHRTRASAALTAAQGEISFLHEELSHLIMPAAATTGGGS